MFSAAKHIVSCASHDPPRAATQPHLNACIEQTVSARLCNPTCGHAARRGPNARGVPGEGDGKTVFVKGFNPNNDETVIREELTETFSKYGEVVEVRLPVDYDTQRVKGFGYIVFAESDGAPVCPPQPTSLSHELGCP
jgi:hypothetical protein